MLRGKSVQQVSRLADCAADPMLMVAEGIDLSGVKVVSIPGAVKFCVLDEHDPNGFAAGYVVFVNGKMSPLYQISEGDIAEVEKNYGPRAAAGIRNTVVICSQ